MKKCKYILILVLILLIFTNFSYAEGGKYYAVNISNDFQELKLNKLLLPDGEENLYIQVDDVIEYGNIEWDNPIINRLKENSIEYDSSIWIPFDESLEELSINYQQDGDNIYIFSNKIEAFKEEIGSLYDESYRYNISYLDNISGKLGIVYTFSNNFIVGNYTRLALASSLYYRACLSSLILYNDEDIEIFENLARINEELLIPVETYDDIRNLESLKDLDYDYNTNEIEDFLIDYKNINDILDFEHLISFSKTMYSYRDASDIYLNGIEKTFLKYPNNSKIEKSAKNIKKLYGKEDSKRAYFNIMGDGLIGRIVRELEKYVEEEMVDEILSKFINNEAINITNRLLEKILKLDEKMEGINFSRYYKKLQDELLLIYKEAEKEEDYMGMKNSMLLYLRIYDKAIEKFDFDKDIDEISQEIKETVNELTEDILAYNDINISGFKVNEKLNIDDLPRDQRDSLEYLKNFEEAIEYEKLFYEQETTISMLEYGSLANEEWNNQLNKIYDLLREELSDNEFEELSRGQEEWIKERDAKIAEIEDEYAGGSIAPIFILETNISYAKNRTLELTSLYFKKVQGISVDLESLLNGLSILEE